MGKKQENRFWEYESPEINECRLCDSDMIYKEGTGIPIFVNISVVWAEFKQILYERLQQDGDEIEELKVVGGELLKLVERQDSFAISILLSRHPDFLTQYLDQTKSKELCILLEELTKK